MGRRRCRQDVAADERAQMVSAVGLESLLWSSETWAGKQLQIQKKNPARSHLLKTWYLIFKTIHKQDCSRARILKDDLYSNYVYVHYLGDRQDARVVPWLM